MIDSARARELAAMALEAARSAEAEEAEALLVASEDALTRFAGNRIHQNVSSEDVELQIRAVIGPHVGVASTNRAGADGIAACVAAAVDAARRAPADPAFPGLPGPHPVEDLDRVKPGTLDFDPSRRAEAAEALIAPARDGGGSAAGGVSRQLSVTAVANTLGVDVAAPRTSTRTTVLATGHEGGTGWASFASLDAHELDAHALGERAA